MTPSNLHGMKVRSLGKRVLHRGNVHKTKGGLAKDKKKSVLEMQKENRCSGVILDDAGI